MIGRARPLSREARVILRMVRGAHERCWTGDVGSLAFLANLELRATVLALIELRDREVVQVHGSGSNLVIYSPGRGRH